MKNKDAEAALLALGATLTWTPGDVDCAEGVFSSQMARTEDAFYTVYETRRLSLAASAHVYIAAYTPFAFRGAFRNYRCPLAFKRLSDAKLACERHVLSGKWK